FLLLLPVAFEAPRRQKRTDLLLEECFLLRGSGDVAGSFSCRLVCAQCARIGGGEKENQRCQAGEFRHGQRYSTSLPARPAGRDVRFSSLTAHCRSVNTCRHPLLESFAGDILDFVPIRRPFPEWPLIADRAKPCEVAHACAAGECQDHRGYWKREF